MVKSMQYCQDTVWSEHSAVRTEYCQDRVRSGKIQIRYSTVKTQCCQEKYG